MALDGAFLYAVKQELSSLIGGRIDKVYQPSRDEIIISIILVFGRHFSFLLGNDGIPFKLCKNAIIILAVGHTLCGT